MKRHGGWALPVGQQSLIASEAMVSANPMATPGSCNSLYSWQRNARNPSSCRSLAKCSTCLYVSQVFIHHSQNHAPLRWPVRRQLDRTDAILRVCRCIPSCASQSFTCFRQRIGVNVCADKTTAQRLRCHASCAGSNERVAHQQAGRGPLFECLGNADFLLLPSV